MVFYRAGRMCMPIHLCCFAFSYDVTSVLEIVYGCGEHTVRSLIQSILSSSPLSLIRLPSPVVGLGLDLDLLWHQNNCDWNSTLHGTIFYLYVRHIARARTGAVQSIVRDSKGDVSCCLGSLSMQMDDIFSRNMLCGNIILQYQSLVLTSEVSRDSSTTKDEDILVYAS